MPTIFIIFGYRFYFWSNEHNPIHVHVEKETVKQNITLIHWNW